MIGISETIHFKWRREEILFSAHLIWCYDNQECVWLVGFSLPLIFDEMCLKSECSHLHEYSMKWQGVDLSHLC